MTVIKSFTAFSYLLLSVAVAAQPKEFEGRIVYKTNIQSKAAGVENKIWYIVLAAGENTTSYVKQGNYKVVTGRCSCSVP